MTLRDRDLSAEGLILLEGSFLVERGFAAGLEFLELSCVPEAEARWRAASGGACPMRVLPEPELAALIGYPFHRGAFALAKRPALGGIGGPSEAPAGHLLCLWQVTDPDNLGALMRSGIALGAAGVALGPGCADPFYRKALRASMGAALAVPLLKASEEDLVSLCSPPRTGIAAALGGLSLADAAGSVPSGRDLSLFLGNEGWGLPEGVLKACSLKIEIPMSGATDSLNVAAAGAILMWELFGKGAVRAAGSPPRKP